MTEILNHFGGLDSLPWSPANFWMANSIYWKNFFLNFEGMNKISSTILAKFLKNYIVIKVGVVASKDATQLMIRMSKILKTWMRTFRGPCVCLRRVSFYNFFGCE